MLIAGTGEPDADLVAAEDGNLARGRRVLLVEYLALPAAIGRAVGAEIIEIGITAEDAAVEQQHDAGQAAIHAVQRAEVDRVEPVDDAAGPDFTHRRQRRLVEL